MICAECAEEVEDGLRPCPACAGEPLLVGRFRIDAIEQVDALGTTYRATRVGDGDATPVWLRELPFRRGPGDPGSALDVEATRLAKLQHAGLPTWLEHFVRREGRTGALWLVQAHVAGIPLARLVRERSFSESEVLARLEQLAELLAYLHGQSPPVVHGAITPSNVVEQAGSGRLILIGFNAIGTDREINPSTGSGVQTVARALASMAPEQFFGRADPASDVWGLGLIAVVLLTGATPLELRNPDHQLIWRDRVKVDESLADLLDTMLDRDGVGRPSAIGLYKRISAMRLASRSTIRIPRDELIRGRDRPPAVAGTIGERRPGSVDPPDPVRPDPAAGEPVRASRPTRSARRSESGDDVPVMRPADLSRELSLAQQANEQRIGRTRRRLSAARLAIVLAVALATAAVVWLSLL